MVAVMLACCRPPSPRLLELTARGLVASASSAWTPRTLTLINRTAAPSIRGVMAASRAQPLTSFPGPVRLRGLLPHYAGSRPHAGRHRGGDGHGESDEQPAHSGRQHLDPVPGIHRHTSGGVAGLLTQEAAPGGMVTYTFTARHRERTPITAEPRATCRWRWGSTAR